MSQLNGDNNKRSRLEEETILGIDANDDKNNHRFDPDDNGPTKVSKIRRTARKTTVPKRYHPPSPSSDEETGMDSEDDQLGVLFKSREVTISTKNEPAKKTTRTRTSRTRTSKVTSSKGRFGVQTILINEPILPSETINRISSIVRSGESSVKEGMIKSYIQEVKAWQTLEELFTKNTFLGHCKLCEKDFDSKAGFLTHDPCYSHKRKMRETFINGPKRAFDCEVCLREFDTMKDLCTHAEFHFVPNFKCNKCTHGFKDRESAEKHSRFHPKTKGWNCTFPGCGHTYTSYGNIQNHIAGTHFHPDQRRVTDVAKSGKIITAKKEEDLSEKERQVFEGAFVPWYQSISHWYKCNECNGLEMVDEDVVSLLTDSDLTPCGSIEQESNDQAGGQEISADCQKSAEPSKTTNSFKDHAQKFPNHKPFKLYKCIFTIPPPKVTRTTIEVTADEVTSNSGTLISNSDTLTSAPGPEERAENIASGSADVTLAPSSEANSKGPSSNCDRKYTDVRQMRDHIERTHYNQVKSCPSYKSFLSKKLEEHKRATQMTKGPTTHVRSIQAMGGRPMISVTKDGAGSNKPAGSKSGIRAWCQGPDGNYYREKSSIRNDEISPYGGTSSKSIVKGNSVRDRIQQMKETDIDSQHYAKMSPGSYCRLVMERDTYTDMIAKKSYTKQCDQCRGSFDDCNHFWFHQPCYDERRLRRIERFPNKNYQCEYCSVIYEDYESLIKHNHHNPSFKCTLCDHWSTTPDLAILHTQVHTKEKMFKCIYPGCERGLIGWTQSDVCRDHIYKQHIFKDGKKGVCRERECGASFKTAKERARHEKEKHPILYHWDDYRLNSNDGGDPLGTPAVTISVVANSDGNSKVFSGEGALASSSQASTSQSSTPSVTISSGNSTVTFGANVSFGVLSSGSTPGGATPASLTLKVPAVAPTRIANTPVMKMSELEAYAVTTRGRVPQVYIPEFSGDEKSQESQRNLWLRQFIQSFPTPENFRTEMYSLLPFDETCNLCNRSFRLKVNFIIHKPCYYVRRSRQLMESGVEEAARYQCDVCSLTFQEMERLRDHMTYHLEPQYQCNYDPSSCTVRFPNHDRARDHIYKTHLNWRQYGCIFDPDKCQLRFHYLKACREHILSTHLRIHLISCEEPNCTFSTNNKRRLKIHMNKHNNPKSYACPVENCNHTYTHNGGRLNHIRTAHPELDPNEVQKLKQTVPKRVDGIMAVINGEPVVVQTSSYTPLEAEMRRAQVTGTNIVSDLSQAIQYI